MLTEATALLIKSITSQVRYNEIAGTLKLGQSGANEPEEQRYRTRRQRLTHKLADFMFWLCCYENRTRAEPQQKTYTATTTRKLLTLPAVASVASPAAEGCALPGLVMHVYHQQFFGWI